MHRTAVDSPNVGAGEASGTKASRPTTQVSIVYCRVVSRTLTPAWPPWPPRARLLAFGCRASRSEFFHS